MLRTLVPVGLLVACTSSPPREDGASEPVLHVEPTRRVSESGELPFVLLGPGGRPWLSWVEREGRRAGTLRLARADEEGVAASVAVVRGDDLFLNWADFPSVVAASDGSLVAQWLRSQGRGYGVEVARSTDGGATWGAPRPLHDDRSEAEHGFVSLASTGGARVGAVWLDGRRAATDHAEGEYELRFRFLGPDGELGREQVLDPRVCSCCQTDLVATADGGLLAVYRDRSADEVRDVSFVRFDGRTWSAPRPVHEDGWVIAGCPVNGPQLAQADGSVAVAWYTGAGERGGDVLLAFWDAEAGTFGAPIDVDDGLPVGRVDVAFLGDAALVTWLEYAARDGDEGERGEWRARLVTRDGAVGPSAFLGEVDPGRTSGFLRLASSGDEALLAWRGAEFEAGVVTARVRRAP